MTALKVRNALICEYIADGPNKKKSLINVYGGNIIVEEFPSIIPLAFYLEIFPEIEEETRFTFDLELDKKGIVRIAATVPPPPTPGHTGVIIYPQFAFELEKTAEDRIISQAAGGRRQVLLRKTIGLGKIPR